MSRQPPGIPRRERIRLILERDGHHCVWCRRPLTADSRLASLEHVVPRLKGGPAWLDNEVAACRSCNRSRGHRSPTAYLDELELRGLEPDRAAVEGALQRLDEAIERHGGQRRARPYLAGQLRRIAT